MTAALFHDVALVPALRLLPPFMDSPAARALLVAIALQESQLTQRRQRANGPARSYFQFERAGVVGVLSHVASAEHAREVCRLIDIPATAATVHRALEFSDVLAVTFARLLVWTLPYPLPIQHETEEAYDQYIESWRPGKPRPETWPKNCADAWRVVQGVI